jgi:hypothetical protein
MYGEKRKQDDNGGGKAKLTYFGENSTKLNGKENMGHQTTKTGLMKATNIL